MHLFRFTINLNLLSSCYGQELSFFFIREMSIRSKSTEIAQEDKKRHECMSDVYTVFKRFPSQSYRVEQAQTESGTCQVKRVCLYLIINAKTNNVSEILLSVYCRPWRQTIHFSSSTSTLQGQRKRSRQFWSTRTRFNNLHILL